MIKEVKKFTKYQMKTVFEYFNDLYNKPGQNPAYSAFVYENHEILLPHYIALQRAVYDENNDPQFHEFNKKTYELQMKFADVKNGQPAVDENKRPVITEKREEFQAEFAKLCDEYKELHERVQNKGKTNSDIYSQTIELQVAVLTITQFVNDAPPYIVGAFLTGAV